MGLNKMGLNLLGVVIVLIVVFLLKKKEHYSTYNQTCVSDTSTDSAMY